MIEARLPKPLFTIAVVLLVAATGYYGYRAITQTQKYDNDTTYHRDFDHFYRAAVAAKNGDDPYESFRKGYIYPPLIAAAFQPIAGLERNAAYLIWFAANATIIAAAFVIAARALLKRMGVQPRAPTVACVVAGGLVPAFDQMRWQLEQGQTDGLLLLAFALGLHWLDRRPLLAGLVTGLAANVKYLSLIVLPFAVVRKRVRLGVGVIAGAVAGLLLPAVVFGWERNSEFVQTSLGRLVHVVDAGPDLENTGGVNIHSLTWELNISMPAFAAKRVDQLGLPEIAVPLLAVSLAMLLVAIAWRLYTMHGLRFWLGDHDEATNERIGTFEWLGLIACAMAMSPQTTVRHMVLMTLIYQCAMVLAIVRSGPGRVVPLVGVVVAFLGMTLPPGGGKTWSSEVALPVWRSASGAMWCALVCFACVLWSGLGWVREAQNRSESGSSSEPVNATPM
ncbi:MAG: glycosyltransferase family 87 protein [Planctomycetota bacterium]